MRTEKNTQWLLLVAVLVIATCGLIYELVAGTLASYLLGDSVTQFSTIIGVYLFSMGIGSFLSKYFDEPLLHWFIRIELLVGLVGGFSAPLLLAVFPLASSFRIILYAIVAITGMLVGLEIPLLMRILKDKVEFKELVSRIFTFDYIGALLASLVFPLLLVPHLGLMRTSLFFGIMNIAVGWYLAHYFKREVKQATSLRFAAIVLLVAELVVFVFADRILTWSESVSYNDHVIYSKSTAYQRITITRNKREMRLFLNGNLQFSSADEYRYHEALVHPAMSSVQQPKQVLVLGGGDGLAVREILKYPSVQHITLVDLDPAMTKLFSSQDVLTSLNSGSLKNPLLKVYNEDAFVWLRNHHERFDVIIIDFPDPSNFSIGKLYSTTFYRQLKNNLDSKGIAVIQSTSPFAAPRSFWCIDATLRYSGFNTVAYHNYVPSFGEWGYIMAKFGDDTLSFASLPANLKYVNKITIAQMLNFPDDMRARKPVEPNRLNNQVLVHYFEEEWSKYLD
ncbi:polyamine aminopropyltransferase [Sediminibacterium roseum]|uniref:Polyamine aminopropyltransferase n=1 Tax=Sediminibacterium roseum TaxID=1978412 RepID=A0ABW9ZSP7_9BACT|nr:polyamine aminopropyltransferase [Sediminibacterium roseum]NCI49309.1 polyamine aminopropyltransferase [Sediminibacterium roseum]